MLQQKIGKGDYSKAQAKTLQNGKSREAKTAANFLIKVAHESLEVCIKQAVINENF